MARYSDHDTRDIYAVAQQFRERCLLHDGSLLFDEAEVWSTTHITKLYQAITKLDTTQRSFMEKFADQVKPLGKDGIRLAAEVLAVYFLFPSNVTGEHKKELVSEVLRWSGDNVLEGSLVASALESGIGSGGRGYNTRRPLEIQFLLAFMQAWKRLSQDEQQQALADPWRFEQVVDGVDGADSRQFRHMLLHLLFPDSFERIASGSHKWQIRQAFQGLVPAPHQDDDQHLYQIRQALEALMPDEELDFYWSPLEAAWYDTAEGSEENAPLEVIHYKKQVILYGPPGTGKTYRAKRIAERLIRSAILSQLGATTYFKEPEWVNGLVRSRVHRLQLHPAYSYEDFIRGLHIKEGGGTEYRLGYLPRLIQLMEEEQKTDNRERNLPRVLILDEINRTDLSRMLGECFSLLEDRNEVIELPGRGPKDEVLKLQIPGSLYIIGTMNLIDQSVEQIDFALRRRFLWLHCPFDAEALLAALEAKWRSGGEEDDSWSRVEADFKHLSEAASTLNKAIGASPLLGPQYEVGHTYLLDIVPFLRIQVGTRVNRNRKYFLWQNGEPRRPLWQLWQLSLRPLLSEYLSGLEPQSRERELTRLEEAFLSSPEPSP